MNEQPLGKKYSYIVNVMIFIFPIVINSLQVAGDIVLIILAMMGIYVAISQKISPFIIKEIQVFSYLGIGYFVAVCLAVLFSGQATELAHYIPRDFYFLFAPFIALALYKAEINFNYLLMGTKVALLVLGIIIFYYASPGYSYRSTGVINPGVFGNLAVLLFFIVLTLSQNESFRHKVFTFFALLFGFVAIVGSGTRGAWLSFFLLSGVYLYFIYKQKTKLNIRKKIIIVLVVTSVIFVGDFNKFIQNRINSAYVETLNYMSGDKKNHSSVGERLEMYRAAIDNIEDVPLLFGHGYRTSNIVLFQNDSSNFGKLAVGYNHLHNAYLTNYYNGGIVLLGALLLLLFLPLREFIKAKNKNREDPVSIAGVLLIFGYASFGLVNILLGDTYMNGFYVFFLAIFLLLTNKSLKALES